MSKSLFKVAEVTQDVGTFIHPRLKDFSVVAAGVEILRYRGIDVTLDDVLRQRQLVVDRKWAEKKGSTRWFEFSQGWGDETVWLGQDIQAVLMLKFREGLDNPKLVVFRFDDTGREDKPEGRMEGVPVDRTDKPKPKRVRSRAKGHTNGQAAKGGERRRDVDNQAGE